MKFEIEDFRRFHRPHEADITPITVLVGENSSGKTSFLAGFRYIVQSMSFGTEGSFNREPFFLGAYDQIAHYRGGRFGRSDRFTLGLRLEVGEMEKFSPSDDHLRLAIGNITGKDQEDTGGVLRLQFFDDQSQPILRTVVIENKYLSLTLTRDNLPNFEIVRLDNNSKYDVVASEPTLFFSSVSTTISRNSLSPFVASIQNWIYSHRFKKRTEKVDKITVDWLSLAIKAVIPTYAFSENPVYASAPFRTKPERTYSPVEASSSAEGSHIPILLAQAKAFEKPKWTKIKDALESFGAQSQMFRKIDIKRLGRSDSDPFQLIVPVSKDKSNIIDVGYGVSQIIPLIVETLINDQARFFIFQQPEVHLHPRAQAELGSYFVDYTINSGKYLLLETHSDYIIERIKRDLLRRNRRLDDYLSVLFFDKDEIATNVTRIRFDDDGNVVDPPANYRNFFVSESMRNLGL
jgi:AAA ATPase domain